MPGIRDNAIHVTTPMVKTHYCSSQDSRRTSETLSINADVVTLPSAYNRDAASCATASTQEQ